MNSHTPGPWRTYESGGRWVVATTSPWAYSAVGLLPDKDSKTEQANAHLIAAAPTILQALKNVVEQHVADYGGCLKNEPDSCAFCAARKAIKLAEGE